MWRLRETREWRLILLISVAFTVIGILMVLDGHTKGWPVSVFFGACTTVGIGTLWPAASGSKLDSSIEALLALYPGPILLRSSSRKWFLILLSSTGFAVSLMWMMIDEQMTVLLAAMLGLGVILFAAGVLIAIVQLLPGASALSLDTKGFEVVRYSRRRRTHWHDASGFTPVVIPPANLLLVGYDDANCLTGKVAAFNNSITGRNTPLPDTYGFSADCLANLMARWRERALGERP